MKIYKKSAVFLLFIGIFLNVSCQKNPSQKRTPLEKFYNQSSQKDFLEDNFLKDDFSEDDFFLQSAPENTIRPAPEEFWNVDDVDISHIDGAKKLIAFTFDDAPTRYLENIFAVFASFNEENPDCKASATYFLNGRLFDNENYQLLHSAVALGFELGNHTYSHFDLTTLSDEELHSEIQRVDDILERVDGKPYHLLRAPYGKTNEKVKMFSPTPLIDWTIDTVDWKGVSSDCIYNAVIENAFSGAIVLFHDGYPHTVDALKRLLPNLKECGYQIVNVSQMAKAHGCALQKGKVYIRARKQG